MTEQYERPEEFHETMDDGVEEKNLREALEREELEMHKELEQLAIGRETGEEIAEELADMMMDDIKLADKGN